MSFLVYNTFTLIDLKKICKEKKIKIFSTFSKNDIIHSILNTLVNFEDLIRSTIITNEEEYLENIKFEEDFVNKYLIKSNKLKPNIFLKNPIIIYSRLYHYIFKSKFFKNNKFIDNCIIKVVQKNDTSNTSNTINTINHEFIVSKFAINNLSKLSPNFTYLYEGLFNYNNIFELNNNFFLIYKECVGCITFNKYLLSFYDDINFFEYFMRIYIQVLFTLQIAYEYCEFTHYDLHNFNILIKENKNIQSVMYSTNFGEFKIKTFGKIPVFIDFENTFCNINGKKYFRKINYSFPMQDALKLILFSSKLMKPQYYENVIFLLSYFINFKDNNLNIKTFFSKKFPAIYFPNNYSSSFTLKNYILWCKNFCVLNNYDIFI